LDDSVDHSVVVDTTLPLPEIVATCFEARLRSA
jgi:hypothetical protein